MILYKKRSEGSKGPTPFVSKIFKTFSEAAEAIKDGWVEAPHLIEQAVTKIDDSIEAAKAKKA